jgi:hypothetical protein
MATRMSPARPAGNTQKATRLTLRQAIKPGGATLASQVITPPIAKSQARLKRDKIMQKIVQPRTRRAGYARPGLDTRVYNESVPGQAKLKFARIPLSQPATSLKLMIQQIHPMSTSNAPLGFFINYL